MQEQNVTKIKHAWRLNDLAEAYSLSVAFLRKEIRARRLPVKKVGRAILVLDADFRNYLEQGGREE